jgi:hypothetical protein
MTGAILFWLIVYALSALLFFGTAIVIAVIGMKDLRDLLRKSESRK